MFFIGKMNLQSRTPMVGCAHPNMAMGPPSLQVGVPHVTTGMFLFEPSQVRKVAATENNNICSCLLANLGLHTCGFGLASVDMANSSGDSLCAAMKAIYINPCKNAETPGLQDVGTVTAIFLFWGFIIVVDWEKLGQIVWCLGDADGWEIHNWQ